MASTPRQGKGGVAALLLVGLIASATATAGSPTGSAAACTPTFSDGVEHLCGPATARLGRFTGVVFKHGTCKRSRVGGEPEMTIEIGALEPGAKGNGGHDYFKAMISGPLARPDSGSVIAYHGSKRWSGVGTSFHGDRRSGTFRVRGVPPSRGTYRGSYRC